jgi:hypothetical protein
VAGCPPQNGTQPEVGFAPVISGATVTGNLMVGQPGEVTVVATLFDQDSEVRDVVADLSSLGGPAAAPLQVSSGDTWVFTTTVTPPAAGTRRVTVTATDDVGLTDQFVATASVAATDGSFAPVLSGPSAVGVLFIGQVGTITLSVVATDPDGVVTAVVADLSAVGGPPEVVLVPGANNRYTFTGQVQPTVAGGRVITFVATDDTGSTDVAFANIMVNVPLPVSMPPDDEPVFPPSVTSATITGNLVQNQTGNVVLTATVFDRDGTVQQVTANLASIGGLASTVLAPQADGSFLFIGAVTPTVAGTRLVTFTAVDDDGLTDTFNTAINVTATEPDNQPPVLSQPQVNGTLVVGVAADVEVSVIAQDDTGPVLSVVANLTSIGGPTVAQLQPTTANEWNIVVRVAPTSSGTKVISIEATDEGGATSVIMTNVVVSTPGGITVPVTQTATPRWR